MLFSGVRDMENYKRKNLAHLINKIMDEIYAPRYFDLPVY
jgi:hypothetical protein